MSGQMIFLVDQDGNPISLSDIQAERIAGLFSGLGLYYSPASLSTKLEDLPQYEGNDRCIQCNGFHGHWGHKGSPAVHAFWRCDRCGGTGKDCALGLTPQEMLDFPDRFEVVREALKGAWAPESRPFATLDTIEERVYGVLAFMPDDELLGQLKERLGPERAELLERTE